MFWRAKQCADLLMKRGLIDARLERIRRSEGEGVGDWEIVNENSSSDEVGVVGRSESGELGLEF